MTKKEIITSILNEGKTILDLYENLDSPTQGETYEKFIYGMVKLFTTNQLPHSYMEGTMKWLLEQEGNNLPKQSSGSIHTALYDFDNFISGIENYAGELDDIELEYVEDIYKGMFC